MGDQGRFDELMVQLDHPMIIVTTVAGDVRAGCLVGFHAQCGIEPPLYAVWLSKANHTYRIGALADVFAVHFPRRDDMALAELFGTGTGNEIDKFERCAWTPGPEGVPLLDDCPDRFVGRRTALMDPGADHVCLMLAPIRTDGHAGTAESRLAFSQVQHLEAGHPAEDRQRPA
jgi:flavin reductase (DIM6/NTAB) family NADH-FMN oxidoreductase RutF